MMRPSVYSIRSVKSLKAFIPQANWGVCLGIYIFQAGTCRSVLWVDEPPHAKRLQGQRRSRCEIKGRYVLREALQMTPLWSRLRRLLANRMDRWSRHRRSPGPKFVCCLFWCC